MKKSTAFCLAIILSLSLTAAIAQENEPSSLLADLAERYQKLERFNGSTLIAHKGKIVLSAGYGLASYEFQVACKPETKFNIASLSKQFTAAAILLLEQKGKLSVSDKIGKYIADLSSDQAEKVTIHHLLTHSSGIPSLFRSGPLAKITEAANAISATELIAYSKDLELQFEPGTKYEYSNSGYIMLAAIIEKVSGKSYRAFLNDELFAPLGMTSTLYPDDPAEIIPQKANGYSGFAGELSKPKYMHPDWELGAGGIHSTVEDLFSWYKALQANKILNAAQTKKLLAPHIKISEKRYYGYGWFLEELYGKKIIRHGGTTNGYTCDLMWIPSDDIFTVSLTNVLPYSGSHSPEELNNKAAGLLLGEDLKLPAKAISLTANQMAAVEGKYELSPGYYLEIKAEGNRLISKASGANPWTIFSYNGSISLDKENEYVEAAEEITEALKTSNYELFSDYLSDEWKEMVPAGDFAAMMANWRSEYGEQLAEQAYDLNVRQEGTAAIATVRLMLQMSNGKMWLDITLSEKFKLAGFYIEYAAPSELELMPLAAGKFLADGFRYREKDMVLELDTEARTARIYEY
jgi:CubicO group peptidase (beta-lactamase class C family)